MYYKSPSFIFPVCYKWLLAALFSFLLVSRSNATLESDVESLLSLVEDIKVVNTFNKDNNIQIRGHTQNLSDYTITYFPSFHSQFNDMQNKLASISSALNSSGVSDTQILNKLTQIHTTLSNAYDSNVTLLNTLNGNYQKVLNFFGSSTFETLDGQTLFKWLWGNKNFNNQFSNGGVYGMIQQLVDNTSNIGDLTVTNNLTVDVDLESLQTPLDDISENTFSSMGFLSDISDKLDELILNSTNCPSVPLSLEIVTNIAKIVGFKSDYYNEDTLDYIISESSLYDILNLFPLYTQLIHYIPVANSSASRRSLFNKIYGGLSTDLRYIGIGIRQDLEASLSTLDEIWGSTTLDASDFTSIIHEKLYGTYDIENQLDWLTNNYSSVINELTDFHSDFESFHEAFLAFTNQFNTSFTPPSYQDIQNEYSSTSNLVSDLNPAFSDSGSISSITDNTNIVPIANADFESAANGQWTPETYDYSAFQQSVENYVQNLKTTVNVGSPELNIHFKGWDNTQEQTITLNFALHQQGQDKVNALWHTIFTLCKIAICVWGLVAILQALLSDGQSKSYNDILQGADIDS